MALSFSRDIELASKARATRIDIAASLNGDLDSEIIAQLTARYMTHNAIFSNEGVAAFIL